MQPLTKEYIQELLVKNDKAVIRAVSAIYQFQTDNEQLCMTTKNVNGVGFSSCDAYILSSFAKQISNGRTLSQKQLDIARKKIQKYWRQLIEIANIKQSQRIVSS